MHHTISHWLRAFVADYGYWAVALALLSESAGLPVPGEITLLLASFLAYSEHQLHLGWIVVVATCAATLGGNLGYALGHYGGRPLLDRYQSFLRISPAALKRGEQLFARYGAAAIFFARFVFGMRVFAGPLAGVLRMRSCFYSLQLPGRSRLGHRHRQRRIPLRPALAHPAAHPAPPQPSHCDSRRRRGPIFVVEISPPAPARE